MHMTLIVLWPLVGLSTSRRPGQAHILVHPKSRLDPHWRLPGKLDQPPVEGPAQEAVVADLRTKRAAAEKELNEIRSPETAKKGRPRHDRCARDGAPFIAAAVDADLMTNISMP